MEFVLLPIEKEDIAIFKKDMQDAFQQGAMEIFNNLDVEILSEKDIDESLSKKGAVAYKAVLNGKISGSLS